MLIAPNSGAFPWPTAMIVWGAGDASSEHRHHSVQLILTLTASVRIRRGKGEPWHLCDAALVRADAPHEVDARGATVLIAFVEPESPLESEGGWRRICLAIVPRLPCTQGCGAYCATSGITCKSVMCCRCMRWP